MPLGDFLVEGAECYFNSANATQVRVDLEGAVQNPNQFRKEVEVAVQGAAADQPPQVRAAMTAYFAQVPGSLQRSLQRQEDPSGRTVPAGFGLSSPRDLLQLLPGEMPLFKPGDRPVPGTDLVVEELLGRGGFGEVWRASHSERPQAPPVALKFCVDAAAARSLRKEIDLLDRVSTRGRHPNIVELKYTHLGCNPPCLEYEYIEGGDLTSLIPALHRSKKSAAVQAAQLVLRLAKAVGFAHRLGIVHRDLKPANILVQRQPDGRMNLKVADFGIGGLSSTQEIQKARETVQPDATRTISRGTYTPLYASPQQKRFGNPDPRDDVFALGVIWYQMVSGDLTKGPPSGGAWRKKLVEQGVPAELVSLLESCLEEEAEDRPADAQVLAERLQTLTQPPAPASPTGAPGPVKVEASLPPARSPSGRRPGSASVLACSILIPVGVIALFLGIILVANSSYYNYVPGYTRGDGTYSTGYGYWGTHSGQHSFGVFFCVLGSLAGLAGSILFLIWLSRAWSLVPPEYEGPPPGMAVGLLCVPFFNLYWMFRVIPGLSTALARMLRGRDPARPLGTGYGVGLASCIFSLIPFVNVVSFAILFPIWLNVANRAKNRVIELGADQEKTEGR